MYIQLLENSLKRAEKQKGFDTLNSLKKDLDMIEKLKGSSSVKEEKPEKKGKMSKKRLNKQK